MAQTQSVQTEDLEIDTGDAAFIVRQAQDLKSLREEVARAVAAYVLANADSTLIDITLSTGGAGAAFMANLLVVKGQSTPALQRLSALTFKWFTASDPNTLQTKMNAYLATLANHTSLWAWDMTGGGAGGIWTCVLVTWVTT